MSKQSSYEPDYVPPVPPDEPPDSPRLWRWSGFALASFFLLAFGFLIGIYNQEETTVEVTRMVTETKIENIPVTEIVQVEVTRLVPEVTEVPVTRIVTATAEIAVEVTRIVPEVVITELPVTRIVREIEQFEVTRIVAVPPEVTIVPGNGRGCARFNLELGRNQVDGTPEDGVYIMQEPFGHRLATWTARRGWLDSGWLRNLPLSGNVVYVEVYFYAASGGGPIKLEIVNPASNLPYGWVANDQCHAIEIQFPE